MRELRLLQKNLREKLDLRGHYSKCELLQLLNSSPSPRLNADYDALAGTASRRKMSPSGMVG